MLNGYVVNIFNPINYDIDIDVDDLILNQEKIVTNDYYYKEIDQQGNLSPEIKSKTYRCRLYGIENSNYDYKKITSYINHVKKMIDRVDGWVKCTIKGVDIFNRLLVMIQISDIIISDYLIQKSYENKDGIYTIYNYNKKLKAKKAGNIK